MFETVLILFMLMSVYKMETLIKTKQFEIPTKEPNLSPEEKFMDIFPLTANNFSESVMANKDPWVVIFHQGTIPRTWKTMAAVMRGSAWFGMIDTRVEEKLVKKLKYENGTNNLARVYPYGLPSKKNKEWKYVKNAEEGRLAILDSIPDTFLKIKGRDVEDFLFESFASRPSRFPVVFFTNEPEAPSFMKAIAVRLEKYFNFVKFVLPTIEDFKAIGLEEEIVEMPSLYVLVTPESNSQEISFSAIEYRPHQYGVMNYPNVLQFLFMVNHQFRFNLSGDNQSSNKTIMNMEDVIEIEQRRFQIYHRGRKQTVPPKKEKLHKEPEIKVDRTVTPNVKDEL